MGAPRKRFDPEAVENFLSTGGGILEPTQINPGDDPLLDQTLGAYRVVERIGQGGMSTVYRGQRVDGQFEQSVAVKLLGVVGDRWQERFQREREILAGLEHPNIARILDSGLLDGRQPYLVMEYVAGQTLDRYCDARGDEDLGRRLDLFLQIARAVQFAHGHLVIHRDLKPANILVTEDGQVKLLDFGIARVLEDREHAGRMTLDYMLTPRYATPEQVSGAPFTVASDVYQLGLILFRMLTGRDAQPIEGLQDLSNVVCQRDPVTPSRAMREAGAAPVWNRDLDAIVLQCLAKAPADRYPTAQALIDDLEALRERRPVRARAGGPMYELGCLVRRHRVVVLAGSVALASLIAALVISTRSLSRAQEAEQEAVQELADGRAVLDYMVGLFESNDPAAENLSQITARDLLERGAASIEQDLRDQPRRRATLMDAIGRALAGLADYPAAERLLTAALELRREELGEGSLKVIDTSIALGETLHGVERYDEAEELLRLGLETRQRELGDTHPLTLSVQASLANTLQALGRFDEAERLFHPVVEEARRSPDHDPVELAALLTEWAALLNDRSRLDDVEELHWEAVELLEKELGSGHLQTSRAYLLLAEHYLFMEDPVRAEDLLLRSLEWSRSFTRPHPHVENCLRMLGGCLIELQRPDEAVVHLERALEQCNQLYGPDHARTGLARSSLGRAHKDRRRLDLAAPHIEEGHALIERHLGPDHPRLIESYNDLASLRESQGQKWEVLHALDKAIEIATATLGARHPTTGGLLGKRSFTLYRHEQYHAALDSARQACLALGTSDAAADARSFSEIRRSIACRMFGRLNEAVEATRIAMQVDLRRIDELSWQDRSFSLTYHGRALRDVGELDEAEVVLREALELYEEQRGPDDAGTALAQHELHLIEEQRGQFDAALQGTRVVFERVRATALGNDPRCHVLALDLARMLVRNGELEQAEPLLLAALDSFRTSERQPNYWTGIALRDLAELWSWKGETARARFVAAEALCTLTACLPADSPDVRSARSVLALTRAVEEREGNALIEMAELHAQLSADTGPASPWSRYAGERITRVRDHLAAGSR